MNYSVSIFQLLTRETCFLIQALSEKTPQLSEEPLASSISNFYMTDVISRHSPVMAHCVKARKEMYTGGK